MNARKGFVAMEVPLLKTGTEMETIHTKGAEQFGVRWLAANRAASEECTNLGVTMEHPAARRFVSAIVLRVMHATNGTKPT